MSDFWYAVANLTALLGAACIAGYFGLKAAHVKAEAQSALDSAEALAEENEALKIDLAGISQRRGDFDNLPDINARVLLIEDSPKDTELARILLEDCPFVGGIVTVTSVDEAARAVEQSLVRSEPFRLVLLDLQLAAIEFPDSLIGTLKVCDDIPILVLTGFPELGNDCIRLGARAFMSKEELHEPDALNRAILVGLRKPRTRRH